MSQSARIERTACRPADVVFCNVEDGGVLLNLAKGVYFGVDSIGARIWELLQTPRTPSALTELLTQEFAVGPDECRRSVAAFLDQMAAHGLIAYEDPAFRS